MEKEKLISFVLNMTDSEDFLDIVSKIFTEMVSDTRIDCIELYQVNGDSKTGKRILLCDKNISKDVAIIDDINVVIAEAENNANKVILPVFIRQDIAMYVIATKDNITAEDIDYLVKITLLIQNIATNKNFKDSLASSYMVLENALDQIPIGVAVLDQMNRKVLLMNKVAAESEAVQNVMGIGLEKYSATGDARIEEIYEDRTGLWFDVQFTDLLWINGEKVLICTTIDVTQKIKNQQRIEYQANNDYLTGLFNRMKCERDLTELVQRAKANNEKGVVVFLDLDNFKQVNDGLGHQYGDVLLQEIAQAIQGIEEIKNSCYRMGGDEFVIVIHPEYFKDISRIIDTISKRFNEAWHIMDVDYYCTMSMGLAVFPEHGKDYEEIIKNADYAMYEAKKGGKNKYLWYTSKDEEDNQKKAEFESSIKDMVGNSFKDFEIHYQPIVDSKGKIYGAEALVRINSGEMGKLMPAEFLPVAEYLGLMNRIGNHVFERACETLKEWNDKQPQLKMFVNMAPTQLMVSKAAEQLVKIVDDIGAIKENIYCEVSEKTDFRDPDTALATMEILTAYGINVSLDDFGAGKMSIDFLKRSKANLIKFDSSFSRVVPPSKYSMMILRTIGEIAKELNIEIGFVGIETEDQNKLAIMAGAGYLEGFFYGEALSKDNFEKEWL